MPNLDFKERIQNKFLMILKTNRIYSISAIVCFAISMFTTLGLAQNSTLYTSKDSLSVGEVFNLSIKVQLDQSYEKVIFPDSTAFPPIIDWIDKQQFRVTEFADSVLYKLQFFSNTDVTLPPFQIGLLSAGDTTFIFTNSIKLYFKTVLPSEDAELKPLKPIFSFSGFPWALAIIVFVILLAALVAYYTFYKKNDSNDVKEIVTFDPYQNPLNELVTTLEYLKNDYDLPATKDYKYFYSAVSDSIRTYYEDLYNIPALESTSRELFRYLDAFGVDHEMIKNTRLILNRSDMVKFAKFTPTLDDAWKCYQFAYDFVDRARLVDASRISRRKAEYENQFKKDEDTAELNTEVA